MDRKHVWLKLQGHILTVLPVINLIIWLVVAEVTLPLLSEVT